MGTTPRTLAERIKWLRVKHFGDRGKAKFAKKIAVTGATVGAYERGTKPGADVLQAISKTCNVSLRWLVTGDPDPDEAVLGRVPYGDDMTQEQRLDAINRLLKQFVESVTKSDRNMDAEDRGSDSHDLSGVHIVSAREIPGGLKAAEFYALPLLDDAVAAGQPREVQDAHTEGVAIVHRSWCPHPKETAFVPVKGDSMEPTIPNGALITVDAAEKDPEQLIGRVVVIAVEGDDATVKRLAKTKTNQYVGMPDNPTPDNQPIFLSEGARIIGSVRSVHAEVK